MRGALNDFSAEALFTGRFCISPRSGSFASLQPACLFEREKKRDRGGGGERKRG